MFSNALDPALDILEGILFSGVVDDKCPLCFAVVTECEVLYAEVIARYCYCPAE